jgi:phosphoenolpyruvate carboxykinase (GTP)
LDIAPAALDELLTVSPALWQDEFAGIDKYFGEFGERVPAALKTELKDALQRVHSAE